jgi:hypothetical protein
VAYVLVYDPLESAVCERSRYLIIACTMLTPSSPTFRPSHIIPRFSAATILKRTRARHVHAVGPGIRRMSCEVSDEWTVVWRRVGKRSAS